jgi:PAS domain S-box-containing protein
MDDAGRRRIWEAEERFRLLVESVEDYAIFMLDDTGHIKTWNPGARRVKGYEPSEALGRHFSIFYPAHEIAAGKCERVLGEAAIHGRYTEEGWRLRKDGSSFWASVTIASVKEPGGDLVGFAKVTRDLTERHEAEEERLRLARAHEAVRLREEFVALASHELKTPLTALQLQLQRLRLVLAPTTLEQRAALDGALSSCERLAMLVEDLLELSSMRNGQLYLHREPLELGALVEEGLERIREHALRAGCELQLAVDGPLHGCWDRRRLTRVLGNLVANAIKYGGGRPIAVTVRSEEGRAVLEVRDGGPGIDSAALPRIFEPFERDPSILHHSGLGLGLYAVRCIVDAHGGEASARNLPGGGACLTVTLPLGDAPAGTLTALAGGQSVSSGPGRGG